MLKSFFVALIAFTVLDFAWLGFVVKDFNMRQLADIGRIESGEFKILYIPAGLTYLLMAIAVSFFVLPRIDATATWWQTFLLGALMGLIVYGVFDLTNLAILKNYPLPFVFADIAWGCFIFGAVTLIASSIASVGAA
jgi:uncharacterized membrane protein